MIIRKRAELGDQPGHEVDADRRQLARRRGREELAPAFWAAVENRDSQMPEVRPHRDLRGPYGASDQLGGDHQGVPAQPVADQLGERCERGSALASAERSNQEGAVVLIEPGRGALLV